MPGIGEALKTMEREPSKYRSFGSRRYEMYDLCFSEDEAKGEAEELRRQGFFARRVRTHSGTWQLYRRKRDS